MDPICVPPNALESAEDFTVWFKKTRAMLYPEIDYEDSGINSLTTHEKVQNKFDTICRFYNLIFHGNDNTIDVVTKNRKHRCSKIDIIATVSEIILSRFQIRYIDLCRVIKVHHTTLIYYRKRHQGSLASREFKTKYLRLISILEHERIIPAIEGEEPESKWVLSSVLSRAQL